MSENFSLLDLEYFHTTQARFMARELDKEFFGTITDEDRARFAEQERIKSLWYRRIPRNCVWWLRGKWSALINLRLHDQRYCECDDCDD